MYPSKPANGRIISDDKFANQNLEVGDLVDVPGMMHGIIKFIGEVKGKKGHFAGVELSKEFAAKGKNDGDVDGYASIEPAGGVLANQNTAYDTSLRLYAAPASFCPLTKLTSGSLLPSLPSPCLLRHQRLPLRLVAKPPLCRQ